MLSLLAVFIFISFISNLEKALIGSQIFCAFYIIIQTKYETRKESLNDWRFLSIIGTFAVIHIIAIWAIDFPEFSAGMVPVPFAIADGFLMWWMLNWFERRFLSKPDNKQE